MSRADKDAEGREKKLTCRKQEGTSPQGLKGPLQTCQPCVRAEFSDPRLVRAKADGSKQQKLAKCRTRASCFQAASEPSQGLAADAGSAPQLDLASQRFVNDCASF